MVKLIILIVSVNVIFFTVDCKPYKDKYKRFTEPQNDGNNTETGLFEDSNEDKNNSRPTCPDPTENAYSREDLSQMVIFFVNQYNIIENIHDGYSKYALDIIANHYFDLDVFQDMVQYMPKHLIHIISIIKDQTEVASGLLNKLNKNMKVDHLEMEFNEAIENANSALNNLKNYVDICKNNNCVTPEELPAMPLKFAHFKLKDDGKTDDYYCDNIDHIKEVIETKLHEFENDIINQLNNEIYAEKNLYKEIIIVLKKTLKETTIDTYSSTMYDLLTLMDDQIHFEEDLIEISELVHNVKILIYKLGGDLEYLNEDLEKFEDYCLNCDEENYVLLTAKNLIIPLNLQNLYTQDNSNQDNILEQILQDEYQSLRNMFLELYKYQTQQLYEELYTFIEHVVENMVFLHEALDNELKTEINEFMELRLQFPYESYGKLRLMYANLKKSIKNVEWAQEFLDHILNHQENYYEDSDESVRPNFVVDEYYWGVEDNFWEHESDESDGHEYEPYTSAEDDDESRPSKTESDESDRPSFDEDYSWGDQSDDDSEYSSDSSEEYDYENDNNDSGDYGEEKVNCWDWSIIWILKIIWDWISGLFD